MRLRVGCAMWAYKAWQGLHFPDRLAGAEQLGVYASWCNAVEGNTTFYGLPAPRTVASWANEAPAASGSCSSCRKAVTHEHHLPRPTPNIVSFLDGSPRSATGPSSCRSSSPHRSDPPTSTRSPRSCAACRRRIATPSSCATAPSTTTRGRGARRAARSASTTANGSASTPPPSTAPCPPSAAERGARRQKPHLPRRLRALTDHPVVRFVGTDDPTKTAPVGSRGCACSPDGSARAAPPPCSSTPPTTSPRRPWPADCTTRSARTYRTGGASRAGAGGTADALGASPRGAGRACAVRSEPHRFAHGASGVGGTVRAAGSVNGRLSYILRPDCRNRYGGVGSREAWWRAFTDAGADPELGQPLLVSRRLGLP